MPAALMCSAESGRVRSEKKLYYLITLYFQQKTEKDLITAQ